jgi:large subunit ribosomal protein L2
MGKRILQRRRGKAGIQFRARTRGKISPSRYPRIEPGSSGTARVTAILDERGRSAPLMQLEYGQRQFTYVPAVAGVAVGNELALGIGSHVGANRVRK